MRIDYRNEINNLKHNSVEELIRYGGTYKEGYTYGFDRKGECTCDITVYENDEYVTGYENVYYSDKYLFLDARDAKELLK